MKRATLALALLCGVAQAQEPPQVYAMMAWQQMGRAGQVRVYGPIAPSLCSANLTTISAELSRNISPDLQLAVRVCAPPLQLQSYVAAFRCAAVDHSRSPKSEAQVWVYACFGP